LTVPDRESSGSADPLSPPPQGSGSLGRALKAHALGLAQAVVLVAIVGSLMGHLGALWWFFDLGSHFRLQYLGILMAGGAVFLLAREWIWAGTAGLFAIVNAASILPFYDPPLPPPAGEAPLRVLVFNLLSYNSHYRQVQDYLRAQSPDLLLLLEVDSAWARALGELSPQFPHQFQAPREDNFGIAILSRIPFDDVRSLDLSPIGIPSIEAQVQWGGHSIVIVGTHPVPPGGAAAARLRDGQLSDLGRRLGGRAGPRLLLGDLNATAWSHPFQQLLRDSGLRDSMRGFGLQPTWLGPFGLFRLAIDHILVSPEFTVCRREVGPGLGSDHRPLIAELALPRRSPGASNARQ